MGQRGSESDCKSRVAVSSRSPKATHFKIINPRISHCFATEIYKCIGMNTLNFVGSVIARLPENYNEVDQKS